MQRMRDLPPHQRRASVRSARRPISFQLFPDSGERYLSKLNEQWLKERGLLDEETGKLV